RVLRAANEHAAGLAPPTPPQGAAGIIVEYPHRFALTHEPLDQGGAEKAAAAGDQNALGAHPLAVPCFCRRPHSTSAARTGNPDPGRTDGAKWDRLNGETANYGLS